MQKTNWSADHNLKEIQRKDKPTSILFLIHMSRFFLHLWNSLHSLMLIISPGVELPCHRGSSKKPFLETWYKWEEHAKKNKSC